MAAACSLRSIGMIDEIVSEAELADTVDGRMLNFMTLYFGELAAIDAGERPEVMNFFDIFSLTGRHAEVVFDRYENLFRRMRHLFREKGDEVYSRREQNARAHLTLQMAVWAPHWLRRYDVPDYLRVAERKADLMTRGLMVAGATFPPPLPPIDTGVAEDEAREAFLRAATALINEQGYHGASVEAISARLNVTKGSFYHHNETKDDLVAQCFERSFAIVREAQNMAEAEGGSGWDRIWRAADALVRYQLSDHGPLLRYTALAAMPEGLRDQAMKTMNRLTERFAGMIADGVADRSIRPVDPAVAAQLVDGMINAGADLWRWVADATPDEASEIFAKPLFTGLLRPPVK
ncbi:MAG: TetR/AcrR family transcriptional regulator [Caulobacteraceae bacterium]